MADCRGDGGIRITGKGLFLQTGAPAGSVLIIINRLLFQLLHPGIRLHRLPVTEKLRAALGYDPIRNRIGEGYLMGGNEE